jgi:hypothetical protein
MASKQTKKQIAAGALGLLDPIIRKWAQEIAATIPQNSVMRTQTFESIVGAIKGYLEGYAERYPALVLALVEKATDFEDFLTVALAETHQEGTEARQKLARAISNKDGSKTTGTTKTSNPVDSLNSWLETKRQQMRERRNGDATITGKNS